MFTNNVRSTNLELFFTKIHYYTNRCVSRINVILINMFIDLIKR